MTCSMLNLSHQPKIQLNYVQLQTLVSKDLFRRFCHEVDWNSLQTDISLRQFLKQFSQCENIDDIQRILFSTKSTRRK